MVNNSEFKFIDLFCGIGGFHQALSSLGGRCVFACDIDKHCRATYEKNYGILPAVDITKIDARDIPDHDVLCGGFPCQAFSKAGKRLGFDDPTKGTLFFDVMRIIQEKRPKYVLLENVRNLTSHDSGNTWRVIYDSLSNAGYQLSERPTLFSPHWIGIPHHRERVFIMAVRNDVDESVKLPEFYFNTENIPVCHIDSVLDKEYYEKYKLSRDEVSLLEHWNKFVQNVRTADGQLPGFPVWTECFMPGYWATIDDSYPAWKRNIMHRNYELYDANREFIDQWMKDGKRDVRLFFGAKAKFEWQVGIDVERPNIFDNIIQFRPSGVRVKPGTYFPALVAMVQKSIIGRELRYLTPRECARLQSFPDSFILDESDAQAYKQFGNSVNVEVVKLFARFLMGDSEIRRMYSYREQFGESEIIQDKLV